MRRPIPVPVFALALALALAPAVAPAGPAEVRAVEVRVVAVEDAATLVLADGRRLRLAGIDAPLPEAAAALAELAVGRVLRLPDPAPPGRAHEDRHGRLLAQAERDDGVWLQGDLLRRGLVRVLTRPDARDRATAMLALEEEARAGGRGLWGTAAHAVRPARPEALRRDRHSIQVVEGRVVTAARVRDQVFLNFGTDWRSDVTARIGREGLKRFAAAGVDPLALAGAEVRIRGWIADRNGPMIELTHPEQLERLSAPAAPPPRPAAAADAAAQAGDDEDEGGDE
ncbi:thermonuclease family protein [Azospirillum halopraeferens]|uniref:thermonuclease family protein n=1 Tax=Azospirillum halopraeferens TaxID=34010 RepID=UPI000402A00A|nr:thermonuclease family protein [Azospirillum halopraeferens]